MPVRAGRAGFGAKFKQSDGRPREVFHTPVGPQRRDACGLRPAVGGPLIKFDNVTKRYPTGHEGLAGVSLQLAPGEMAFVTGPSGAGKSTLLKLVGLLERATRGQVWVGGRNLNRLGRRDVPYHRRQVGMVFQDHRLLHDRTVFDNVALPLVVAGMGRAETRRRVRAVLDKVSLLKAESAFPIALSGGEQQRVGIARALVGRPPVVLADEPTGNLDPALSREIMELFLDFNRVGVTLLIATHDVELVGRLGRRTIHLDRGRVSHDSGAGA
jgi:cell division transport system ATP-binding protein